MLTHFKRKVFGFTLTELLVVIAITAIISSVGISSYIGQQRAKLLDNTVQEIVGFLRYAQQKSIAQEQGGQWGVRFENSLEQGSFYALHFDPDSGAFQNNHNLVKRIKDKILSIFHPFYAFARVITETERHYLPSGIKYQIPEDSDYVYILFQSLTGFLSFGDSYPQQPYQQIILEDSAGKTANIVVCKQGLITYNEDLGICGEIDLTSPEIGEIMVSDTSFGSFVSSPFKLSASVYEPEGGLVSCQYTVNGGVDWYEAIKSGTGPKYNCIKTGITANDGENLVLNIKAISGGGMGTGNTIQKTVDAAMPICSDNWEDNNWISGSPIDITISCSDIDSGIASVKYCIDTKNSCSPVNSYSIPVSISCPDGNACTQYFRYSSKDNVNNASIIYSSRVRQDRQAPIDGALNAIAGIFQASLSWAVASDGSGSGLATSQTYKLVYLTNTYPNVNCTNGTLIYEGTGTSYIHTGLSSESTYYYRICAKDNVGNVSVGSTKSTKPLPNLKDDGATCLEGTECKSGYCYVDNDGDRYAPKTGTKECQSLSQLSGIDCNDSNASIYPGKVVSVKDCSSYNYYYVDGSASPIGTNYCRYRYYCSQNRVCLADGTVSDPSCCDYCTQTKATCGTCLYARPETCSSASQYCAVYNNVSCGGSCDTCVAGKCCIYGWVKYSTLTAKFKSWGTHKPCNYSNSGTLIYVGQSSSPGSCTASWPTTYETGLLYTQQTVDIYRCEEACPK